MTLRQRSWSTKATDVVPAVICFENPRSTTKTVVAGGSDDISNLVLLCPACHASETEKQEQAVCRNNVWFESHLPPRMHNVFASLPLPQQIHWGEETARCNNDFSIVKCLDIVGCRSNFFYERTRDIPVGCPLDDFEPVYADVVLRRPVTDFEWVWIDILEQQDWSDGFQDVPDLHRLYGGPYLPLRSGAISHR